MSGHSKSVSESVIISINLSGFIIYITNFLPIAAIDDLAFLPLGNSDHVVVSVSVNLPSNPQWDAAFQRMVVFQNCFILSDF